MRPLQQLPVWVVIRLCTDEDRMVDYWNSVDGEIELNMDVIDDPNGEAREIHEYVMISHQHALPCALISLSDVIFISPSFTEFLAYVLPRPSLIPCLGALRCVN